MKDELNKSKKQKSSLDERFAKRPEVRARLHAIADMMDRALARGATAEEAEALAIAELRRLGASVMTDWARAQQEQSLQEARRQHPSAICHIKKK